jgi:hypothetical protein
MINPWVLLLSTIISAIVGLFSRMLGRLFEEWRYRPGSLLTSVRKQRVSSPDGHGAKAAHRSPTFTSGLAYEMRGGALLSNVVRIL